MLNVLNSHAYTDYAWTRLVKAQHPQFRFLMDSGAFTCFMSKAVVQNLPRRYVNDDLTLSLDGYLSRIDDMGDGLWNYIMLDVVMNESASMDNLHEMVKRGYKPMPVLTSDAPLTRMAEFVDVNEHVCVAGGVTAELEYYSARLEAAWRASGKRAKLHGLGFTRYASTRTRAWSVDSSSWLQGGRYGHLAVFDEMKGGIYAFDTSGKRKMTGKVFDLLRRTGGAAQKAVSKRSGTFSLINILSTYSWLEYAAYARRNGLEFFFAVASIRDMLLLASVAAATGADGRIDFNLVAKARDSTGEMKYDELIARTIEGKELLP